MGKCKSFEISIKNDGLYLTLEPARGMKGFVEPKDVLYYIERKKLPDCDVVLVSNMFKSLNEEAVTQKISEGTALPISEFGEYKIGANYMKVEAIFYPPTEGATLLTEQDIIKDLTHIGVKFGIKKDVIAEFIANRMYCKSYVLAAGEDPRDGKDGFIEYNFSTHLKPVPKVLEDGTVDFHTLENVNHVKVGDVVAVLHPEDRGDDGKDVVGRVVRPKKVNHVIFRHGNNLKISEDGLSLIAQVNGHVTLEDDKVFVSNVMELVDIDNSTGNIEYEGSVNIKGNVLAGFQVHAKGDITVAGIVEGATLIADGNITLNRGVQGMNKAVIKAGGNIVTKFIECANLVQAGGSIDTDSILHSRVIARGTVKASGKNGLIVGGEVKSTGLVEAKTIGNEMGTATIIGVGVDPSVKSRVDELKKELDLLGNNKIQLNQVLEVIRKRQHMLGKIEPDKAEIQQKTMRKLLELEKQLNDDKKELQEIRDQLSEDENARIKVNNCAYVGTKLVFGEQFLFIKQKCDYCQFIKDKADIKCMSVS